MRLFHDYYSNCCLFLLSADQLLLNRNFTEADLNMLGINFEINVDGEEHDKRDHARR